GEFTRVNDRRSVARAEPMSDFHTFGKPGEFGRLGTVMVAIRNDGPAIGAHVLVRPISSKLPEQGGMKLKAAACQRIERRAHTPVESQKATGLARCRSSHLGPLDNNDLDTATTEKMSGAGTDHAASADHNAHGSPSGMIAVDPCYASQALQRGTAGNQT